MSLTNINSENFYKKGVIGNVRKAQEDSHDFAPMTPNGDVFVVCDGMGGHVGGAKASSLAVEGIITYLKKEAYASPIEALDGALQFANMQILGFANENPEYQGMGTTACIVLFRDNDVWIAHVGDSRIYLYLSKERQLHRITKDHSYVQSLVDAGEITDDQAEHHPMKNRITKALGIRPELQPTFNYQNVPIHPKDGDIFLICTDGLSGMITDKTIASVLSEGTPLEQRGDRLIDLAMQGEIVQPGGQDNCTLELIRIEGSPWKESQFVSYNPGGQSVIGGSGFNTGVSEGSRRPLWKTPLFYGLVVAALLLICTIVIFLKPSTKGQDPVVSGISDPSGDNPKVAAAREAYREAWEAYQTAYNSEKEMRNKVEKFKEIRIKAEKTKKSLEDQYKKKPTNAKLKLDIAKAEEARYQAQHNENEAVEELRRLESESIRLKNIMEQKKAALEALTGKIVDDPVSDDPSGDPTIVNQSFEPETKIPGRVKGKNGKEGDKGVKGGEQGGEKGGVKGGEQGGEKGGVKGGEQGGEKGGVKGGEQGGEKGGVKGGEQGGEKGGVKGGEQGGEKGGK